MKRQSSLLVLSCCMTLANVAANAAAPAYPTKPFDVTYTVKSPQSTCTMRMATDGKGHMRTETSAAGNSVVSLMDYPNMTQTSLIEQGKMAMKSKIPPQSTYVTDAESAKKANATSLGTKVINGHPCHGWAYNNTGAKSEVWTADDLGFFILSTSTSAAGKTVTEMKSFSKAVPGKEAFEIPPGYKMMNM